MVTRFVDLENGLDSTLDVSPSPKTMIAAGNTFINAVRPKFGSACLDMVLGTTGLSTAAHADFNFGAGQFTLEAWVWFNSHSTTTTEYILGNYPSTGTSSLGFTLRWSSGNQLQFSYSKDGTSTTSVSATAGSPTTGQWYHIAVDRDASGVIRLYRDGVVVGSATDTGTLFSSVNAFTIGASTNALLKFPGYVGGVRVTKGVARYAGAFTPPAANFGNNVGTDASYANCSLILDFNSGGDGTTFATRWKSLTASNGRSSVSDTVKVMATPYMTLVGDATWTNHSRTVTLASAVNATISSCDAAWTASGANITSSTNSTCKQGTNRVTIAVASAFTTGLAAHFPTGALDLSAYQQISLWMQCTVLHSADANWSLKLCSDTAGLVPVNSFPLPGVGAANAWHPVTVDFGGALGSNIQSIALYVDVDLSNVTAYTLSFDNIIACKAPSAADSLSLNSLIGKEHNRSWGATTAYTTGAIRRPSQPNRNGFVYKATTGGTTGAAEPTWPMELGLTVSDGTAVWTCFEQEDTWYPIQSISGTTVKLDGYVAFAAAAADTQCAYQGASETVATYKREPKRFVPQATTYHSGDWKSGADQNPFLVTGGWNQTDMTTQDGETWISGVNGQSHFVGFNSTKYLKFQNINGVRFNYGFVGNTSQSYTQAMFQNCHFNGNVRGWYFSPGLTMEVDNIVANSNHEYGVAVLDATLRGRGVSCHGTNQLPGHGLYMDLGKVRLVDVSLKGNVSGVRLESSGDAILYNLRTSNNSTAVHPGSRGLGLVNPTFGEASPIITLVNDSFIWVQKYQGVDGWTYVENGRGTIETTQAVRHSATGVAWKFNPTQNSLSTCDSSNPLRLSVAKIYCEANVSKTVSVWVRRTGTTIKGRLMIEGGQLRGVPTDKYIDCVPSVNTWVQSDNLVFTPTEAGVVEVFFHVWDGVNVNQTFYIDDLSVN